MVQKVIRNPSYSENFFSRICLRFREECSNGKLSRLHLNDLFQQVFPEGIILKAYLNFIDFELQEMHQRSLPTYSEYLTQMATTILTSKSFY